MRTTMSRRILLFENAMYLPSYGGGNKSNRLLLECLARRGHRCLAVARVRDRGLHYHSWEAVEAALAARGVRAARSGDELRYSYQGVEVHAIDHPDAARLAEVARQAIADFAPDRILVSDDSTGVLLDAVTAVGPDRAIALVHTLIHLPFGPYSRAPSAASTARLREIRVLGLSRFVQAYCREYGVEAGVLHLPVYGTGPFPSDGGRPDGAVLMINPCPLKGSEIFLELVRRFPGVPFAAVPTWGADLALLDTLRGLGVHLYEPVDDIGPILAQARVLLVPSIWAETFGYVAVEAMLRGVPVLAADLGGLPEATLGVGELLPVRPASWEGGDWEIPRQDVQPWEDALRRLLDDPAHAADVARRGHRAARAFVDGITPESMEAALA